MPPSGGGGSHLSTVSITTVPHLRHTGFFRSRSVQGITGVLVLLGGLELASIAGLIPSSALPPVSEVLGSFFRLLTDPRFLLDVASTLSAWGIGLIIATVVAVPAGLLLGTFRLAYDSVRVVIEFLRPVPSVALVPLAVLVLGLSLEMKIALVFFASIWPILFNTLYGVRDIDPVTKETARTFRLSPAETMRRVLLPSAAPFAFTGIRISASIALIVAISAEILAGTSTGIGSFILRLSASGGDTAAVLAATVVAGVIGVLVNVLLRAIESQLFSWRKVTLS